MGVASMSLPTTHKTTTVRLPSSIAAELEDVASFDGVAVAQEIREAIELLIRERKSDPAFRARVHATVSRSRRMLEQLDGGAALSDALDGRPRLASVASEVVASEVAETGR
jgi:predicted DNA-binding protein